MEYIWLTEAQVDEIITHAHKEYPYEACGILAGKTNQVLQVIPTQNSANDPKHHFEIDPVDLSRHLPQIEAEGLSLLGFYHSHPNGESIPSATDIRESTYPNTVQLIIGLKTKQAQLNAWLINGLKVNPVKIHIGLSRPPYKPQRKLSNAQKNAIIIIAIVALVIMVVLSINLLPAPPEIPAP